MATFADVFHAYAKESLGGKLVIRKATSHQTSARLKARQEAVRTKGKAGGIAKAAHEALVTAGKCPSQRVYVAGQGYTDKPVCPIELMKSELRERMR